jgi:hypothetical protein
MLIRRDFDSSKWANIDTSSEEDEQGQQGMQGRSQRASSNPSGPVAAEGGSSVVTSTAEEVQLRALAAEYGIDSEILADMLGQFDGDTAQTAEYMRDFFGMASSRSSPAPAPAAAAAPTRRDFDSSKWDNLDTSSDEEEQRHRQGEEKRAQEVAAALWHGHGVHPVPAQQQGEQDLLRSEQLLEEIAYADGQLAELREKHSSNEAALVALQNLAKLRPAHRQQHRANRQWVNMGDLFLKLPHKAVEGMIRTDQSTIQGEIKGLAQLKTHCQAQIRS